MEQSRPLKILTIAGFIILLASFIAFKTGTFDRYLNLANSSGDYNAQQLHEAESMLVDSPPVNVVDSVRYNPAMMPTSKSVIVIDQTLEFPVRDTVKSDSNKVRPPK